MTGLDTAQTSWYSEDTRRRGGVSNDRESSVSKVIQMFEFEPEDVVRLRGNFTRPSGGDYIDRHVIVGCLTGPDRYLPTPDIDWNKSIITLRFATLDQLDAVIDGLELFRRDWVAENMAHESGRRRLTIAAD